MFNIIMLGAESAFTVPPPDPIDQALNMNNCGWQSNLLVTKNNKNLLLDCGSDIRFSMAQAGRKLTQINGIYVSHLHADHVGGIEGVAFSNYFSVPRLRPTILCSETIVRSLWENSLAGGLDSIEGQRMNLTSYFDVQAIVENGFFIWEDVRFDLVQVVHVMADRVIKHSYGLMIYEVLSRENGVDKCGPKVFWTSDTQFCPNQIKQFYREADVILHDCETSPFRSGVHAHYEELKTLDEAFRRKMWLYHYQPNTIHKLDAVADGFHGFLKKGDFFEIDVDNWTAPDRPEPSCAGISAA